MAEDETEKKKDPGAGKGKKSRMKEKMNIYFDKVKGDEKIKQGTNFLWDHRIEIFSGALVLVGIVLAFFYIRIGGILVGLGFGIGFFEDIKDYFTQLRNFYSEQGLFKTLLLIATVVYFLIALPGFIIAAAVGFAVIFLIRWICRNKS